MMFGKIRELIKKIYLKRLINRGLIVGKDFFDKISGDI